MPFDQNRYQCAAPQDKIGIIYGLADPRYFDLIRYCGQTVGTLENRLMRHIEETEKSKKSYRKLTWMRKLLSLGLEPKPILLSYNISVPFITYLQVDDKFKPFYDYDAINKEERYFIAISKEECASFGVDCVNGTDGGDGGRTHFGPMSEEAKEHMRQCRRPIDEKARRHVKEAANKRDNSRMFRNFGDRTGKNPLDSMTEEEIWQWKDNISRTLTGRSLSKEHRKAIRDTLNKSKAVQRAIEANSGDKNPMSRINVLRRAHIKFLKLLERRREHV